MRFRSHKSWTPARRRSGMLSLELVLVLPIIALVLFAIVEFGLVISARQSLIAASRAGARIGSLSGATEADVAREVRGCLDPALREELVIDVQLGHRSGEPVIVSLRLPMCNASPDLLRCIGLSLHDYEITTATVMCRE